MVFWSTILNGMNIKNVKELLKFVNYFFFY